MLISNAYAAAGPSAGFADLIPFILIFVAFYFMVIRPQMKQAKQHKIMVEALKVGDEVVTTGGMVGKITKVGDHFVSIEVATNTVVHVQRHAIQSQLPPSTIKSI